MKNNKKPSLAFFTSAHSGLAHYVTHLYKPISKYVKPYYVTYSDTVIDDLVQRDVDKVYQLLKDGSSFSISNTLRFLQQKKIDYINFHIGTTARKYSIFYTALLSKAHLQGIKIIGTMHDVMPFESFYEDPAALDLLYSCVDHYIVGSEMELNKLQLYFRIPNKKVTIIKHGPYSLFDNKKYTKESARKVLNIPANKKVILFFGQLKPHKGLKYLIKAFKIITKEIPNSWLYISTDLTYSPQLNEYLARIQKTGASKYIQLVREYVPSEKIEAIFKAADLVVLPYTQISQSGILNLAYAFRKPVVVTDIFPDANLINRRFGNIAKVEDEGSLAKKTIELLSKPSKELEKMGNEGYKYSIQQSSWQQAAQKINRVIKNCS
ncbi:MAG: glycosyltransferase [bacterium]